MSANPSPDSRPAAIWGTWIAFVAVILMLVGVFSVLAGIAAVTEHGFMAAGDSSGEILLLPIKGVGIVWIALGALLVAVGWALIQGREWARVAAVAIAFLHSINDLLMLSTRPFVSLLFIVINLLIIYGVTVRWDEAKAGLGD